MELNNNYGVANGVHQTGAQVPTTQPGKELRIGKGESLVIGGLAVYGGVKLIKGLVNSVKGFAAYSKAMQMQAQVIPNPVMQQVPPQQQAVPPQQAPQQQAAPQGAPTGQPQ